MKFKEFADWCNHRASDGCWDMETAMFCIGVMKIVRAKPFWKREKEWQALNSEFDIKKAVVDVINAKIKECYENG